MKKNLYITLMLSFVVVSANAQDVPLYSQMLTNSFIYNPSVAGKQFGSITLSHRKFWSGIEDAPSSNLLSFHLPFGLHKFGTGVNVFQEKIGIYDRLYASGAFAYHLNFTDDHVLSMGFSAEYNNLKVNPTRLDVIDNNDILLFGDGTTHNSIDFSFGLSYRSKLFELGASANRLSASLGLAEESNQLSQFYTAYGLVKIPLAGDRDLIEPIVTFRQLSTQSNQFDAGIYYTFNNLITLGASYRSSSQLSATAALRIREKLLIGYSYETFNNELRSSLGNSSEITVRWDFNDQRVHRSIKNSRKITNNSLAFRRKTLSRMSSNTRKKAGVNTQKLKKRLKRNYVKSPNYKMNTSKKLHKKKVNKAKLKRQKRQKQYKNKRKKRFR